MFEQLISKIESAFRDVPYPGDYYLTDSTYGVEPAALIKAFAGKDKWQALSPEFLDEAPDNWGNALAFFSDKALHFYLPAYLIADLKGELKNSDPLLCLCSNLNPQADKQKLAKVWGGGTLGEHARAKFSKYTRDQVAVTVEYLLWRLDKDEYDISLEHALEYYWLPRVEGYS